MCIRKTGEAEEFFVLNFFLIHGRIYIYIYIYIYNFLTVADKITSNIKNDKTLLNCNNPLH